MTVAYDIDNAAYRSSEGLSYSESKWLQRSPAHYRWHRDNPGEQLFAGPMFMGTLVHCATLEAHRFDQRYIIGPEVSKNSNQWKAFVADAAAMGLVPITADDRALAFACAASLHAHPTVGPILAEGWPEVACWWTDPASGVECKARLDWVHPTRSGVLLLDVKTTGEEGGAQREAFRRTVTNFQYHRQADWYEQGYARASGAPVSPMLFAVVETKPPYACAAYTLDRWFMAQAAKTNYDLRCLYKACVATDTWPGYDPAITDLEAPRYALDEELRQEQREEEYSS